MQPGNISLVFRGLSLSPHTVWRDIGKLCNPSWTLEAFLMYRTSRDTICSKAWGSLAQLWQEDAPYSALRHGNKSPWELVEAPHLFLWVGMYFFTQYCIWKNLLQAKIELSPLQRFFFLYDKIRWLSDICWAKLHTLCVYLHTYSSGPAPRWQKWELLLLLFWKCVCVRVFLTW